MKYPLILFTVLLVSCGSADEKDTVGTPAGCRDSRGFVGPCGVYR
jgi:hypothetical protein